MENLNFRDRAGNIRKHSPLAAKSYPGTNKELKYIDCSCGWKGRLTLADKAKAEHARHAQGEILEWEVESAHQEAIWENRSRK